MSIEFFEIMEKLEKKIKSIKFLENSHSEVSTKYLQRSINLLDLANSLEEEIKTYLKEKAKNGRSKRTGSKDETKVQVSGNRNHKSPRV